MATVAARGTGTPATTGTTWATTTNAVDGAAGTNPATYATLTSAVSAAVATIEITGYGFSSTVGASDTLNSVTVSLRHFENNTGRFASVTFQAFDGATAIGTATTATLATAARNDTATPAVTLAQLRSSTFKIRVTITGAASTQSRIESIDYVDVTADYTPLPPAITQASYRFYADDNPAAVLIDSYDETNINTDTGVGGTGQPTRVGQTFQGNGKPLKQAGFRLWRQGSPVGNVNAALYAHTGTFGTTGVGTGTALATSTTTVASATISTSDGWVDFDFDGTFTLVNATAYAIVVEATALGDASNAVRVSRDNSTPTHAGNFTQYSGSWSASSSSDLAFRVYTFPSNEATSTALAAQDTGYTADTSAGDVNLQVRVRLQSTNAGVINATDDWQLQWEKNTSGTWTSVGSDALADSYPETNYDSANLMTDAGVILGQSFLGNGSKLKRVRFWGYKQGTGGSDNVTATLYAHTGAFGSTGTGTGAALTTSAPIAGSSLIGTSAAKAWNEFTFAGTYTLTAGTPYVIGAGRSGATDFSNCLVLGADASSPTHAGCQCRFAAGSWNSDTTRDLIFEVYTPATSTVVAYDSANLTDGAATTNRLGAGTGSYVAGKLSEDGLVDDVGWSANNYTELLYSVTIKAADVANADTLKFRVLRNGATTGLTYTATPTLTISAGAPPGGKIKVWTGSAWVEKPVKVWSGSAWVEKPLKVWSGSAWVLS